MRLVLWAGGCWAMPLVLSVMFVLMTAGVTEGWGAAALAPVIVGALVVEALFFAGGTGVFLRHLKDLGETRRFARVATLGAVQAATFVAVAFVTVSALR